MKHKLLIIILYLAVALLAAYASVGTRVDDRHGELYILYAEDFQPSLETHSLTEANATNHTYSISFDTTELDHLNTDVYTMIINKITDHSIRISLNEHVILEEGDMQSGNSNLKNSVLHTTFDASYLRPHNEVIIETYGTYKTGLDSKGIYITNTSDGMSLLASLQFYNYSLILMGLGFLTFSMIFIGIIYFLSSKKDLSFLFCAAATFFLIIYFLDYVSIPKLPVSYLTAKKIFMLSLYIGCTFYVLAIGRFFSNNIIKYIIGFTLAGFIVLTSLSTDMLTYKSFYNFWYILLLINIIVAFVLSIVNLRKSEHAYLFLIGFLAISVFGGRSIISDLLGIYFPINSPIIYIVVMAALPLLIGVEHLAFYEHELIKEKYLRHMEFLRANTDGLTGAWNQRYLTKKLQDSRKKSVVTMLDLDDFKSINDKYGHLAGDAALVHIANLIKSSLWKNDIFCRYGGDEFVILSYDHSKEEFHQRMLVLCESIAYSKVIYGPHTFSVTTSIGIYYWGSDALPETALKKADEALYKSKELGKNRVYLLR